MVNETLIRLKNAENENDLFAAFYTENPYEFLKLFSLCKEKDIPLKYNHIQGTIQDFSVFFGDNDGNLPCIDVWIIQW